MLIQCSSSTAMAALLAGYKISLFGWRSEVYLSKDNMDGEFYLTNGRHAYRWSNYQICSSGAWNLIIEDKDVVHKVKTDTTPQYSLVSNILKEVYNLSQVSCRLDWLYIINGEFLVSSNTDLDVNELTLLDLIPKKWNQFDCDTLIESNFGWHVSSMEKFWKIIRGSRGNTFLFCHHTQMIAESPHEGNWKLNLKAKNS